MNFHLELTCAMQDGKGLARAAGLTWYLLLSVPYHLLVGLPTVYVLFWVWVLRKDHMETETGKIRKKGLNYNK